MALVSVARAKRKKALANQSNDLLGDLLGAASDAAEQWCDRVFASAARTEVHNGNGTRDLFVKAIPITAITSITVTDANGDTESLDVAAGTPDVVYEANSGRISFGPHNSSSFDEWPDDFPQNISVVYTAGYATIPDDVQEAVVLIAVQMMKQAGTYSNPAYTQERMGEHSYTRVGADEPLITPAVEALLGKYRRLEA